MCLGADVIHPAPGSDGLPSFTALVGNVDSDTAKYIAGQWPLIVLVKVIAFIFSRFEGSNLQTRDDRRSL